MGRARYYRESGRCDPRVLVRMLAAGLPVAVIGGLLYGYLSDLNPLIYLNGLGLILLGGWMGRRLVTQAREGKVRNTPAVLGVAALLGLVAEYCLLVAWLYHVMGGQFLATAPDAMAYLLGALSGPEGRVVTLGSIRSSASGGGGLELSGWVLATIWALEAALLVGWTLKQVHEGMEEALFCEGCDAWIEGEPATLVRAPVARPVDLRRGLERLDPQLLDELPVYEGDGPKFLLLSLLGCPSCEGERYLSALSVTCTANQQGGVDYATRPLVRYLQVPDTFTQGFLERSARDEETAREEEVPGDDAAPPGGDGEGGTP